jgi:hypothetical protein
VSEDKRPVLVGMNNPVSSDPAHALFPHPPGCTGYRLWEMLKTRIPHVTRREYLDAFDRRNVVGHAVYNREEARLGASRLYMEFFGTGRTVVLLGAETVVAFGLPRLLLHPQENGGVSWRQIPHPSGRNLWFNDEQNRTLVAMLLEDLYNASR